MEYDLFKNSMEGKKVLTVNLNLSGGTEASWSFLVVNMVQDAYCVTEETW